MLRLLRRYGLELHQLAQAIADPGPTRNEFRFDQVADPGTDLVDVVHTERHRHPAFGSKDVDRHGHVAPGRRLEQQRWAVVSHGPGDDLAHLQRRIHRRRDPPQLTRALQGHEEVAQVVVREATGAHALSLPIAAHLAAVGAPGRRSVRTALRRPGEVAFEQGGQPHDRRMRASTAGLGKMMSGDPSDSERTQPTPAYEWSPDTAKLITKRFTIITA